MRCCYFLLALALSLGISNEINCKENEDKIPKLHVKGESRLLKPAEKMLVHLGVVTQDVKSDKALEDNNVKMQKVISVLQGLGLGPENYKTGQLVVRPRYAEQAIIGYEATNSLSLNTDRLDLAAEILGAVNKAGINSIDSIQFTLKDPREYRAAAIQAAAANAIADAQTLAQAAGVKLVRVLEVAVGEASLPIPNFNMRMAKSFGGESSVPVEPGEVEVVAEVSITYEISSS